MSIAIRKVTSDLDIKCAYPVLKELRTDLTFQDYVALCEKAREADNYQIACAYDDSNCVGFIGYRVLHDFVHGRHLYIDDLVTSAEYRSKGIGATLLKFAETEAQELECRSLRLCTGVANDGGKRFYEREGWQFRSVVYKKNLSGL